MANPVSRFLQGKGIHHRVFRHSGAILSLEQAARERGQKPDQVIRSILFRLSKSEYALVLMAGPSQISWRRLRNYLGKSRLTLANDEEVLGATGYLPGTVSPLGISTHIRVLVDESVFAMDELSIGSGVKGEAVILSSSDLLYAIGRFESGKFSAD